MRLTHGIILAAATISLSACNYDILKDNGRPAPKGAVGPSKATTTVDFAQLGTKILTPYCIECHKPGEDGEDGGVFADANGVPNYAGVMKTVTAGNPDTSKFWTALKNNGGKMPKKKNALSADEIALIKSWIEGGAPETIAQPEAPATPEVPTTGGTLTPTDPQAPLPAPQPVPGGTMTGSEPQPQPAPVPQQPAPQQPAPEQPAPLPIPSGSISTGAPQPQQPQAPPTQAPPSTIPLEATWASIQSNVIATKCLVCHSGATPKAALDLTSYDALMKSRAQDDGTPFIIPGDSANSPIATEIVQGDMPPPKAIKAGKVVAVTAEELTVIQAWIDAGAHP